MKITVFSTKPYDKEYFRQQNEGFGHELTFIKTHLNDQTMPLAEGADAVCVFVNDKLDAPVIEHLAQNGIKHIALRCAGFNNVDMDAASANNINVVNVPAYSPYSVAEHTVGMILSLNRKLHKAYARVREGNFSLDGLMGFDLHGKTAGVVGMGRIGQATANILAGFGCQVLVYDPYPFKTEQKNIIPTDLDTLFEKSDIISLHCPLTAQTRHMIDESAIATMKDNVMIMNTSRGGLIDTQAVIDGLKSKKIGWLGLDVYEDESEIFFENLSQSIIQDDVFSRLLTFPNVLITGHQAFFTKEAMTSIAATTLQNLSSLEKGAVCENLLNKR